MVDSKRARSWKRRTLPRIDLINAEPVLYSTGFPHAASKIQRKCWRPRCTAISRARRLVPAFRPLEVELSGRRRVVGQSGRFVSSDADEGLAAQRFDLFQTI